MRLLRGRIGGGGRGRGRLGGNILRGERRRLSGRLVLMCRLGRSCFDLRGGLSINVFRREIFSYSESN